MSDRVLRHLHEHLVARFQRELDPSRLIAGLDGVPVHFTGIEHGVASPADVDERGLHAGEHVLHATEIDVPDERRVLIAGHIVLDEDVVLQHRDLDPAVLRSHHHDPVDGLAAREEFGLGDHGTTATGFAPVTAALLLRLEARGSLDPLRLGHDLDGPLAAGGPGRFVVAVALVVLAAASATSTTAARAAPRLLLPVAFDVVIGPRRQHRDLGCVEVQLRRHRGDEPLRQETETDSGQSLRFGRFFGRRRRNLGLGRGLGLSRRLGARGRRRLGGRFLLGGRRDLGGPRGFREFRRPAVGRLFRLYVRLHRSVRFGVCWDVCIISIGHLWRTPRG